MRPVGGRLLSLGGIWCLPAIFFLKMSARTLFNDVLCFLTHSVATNLRHDSVWSPRQTQSVNAASFINTVALPIPAAKRQCRHIHSKRELQGD